MAGQTPVQLQNCTLYKHTCAVIENHHICPKSWWEHAGKPVNTPMAVICPNDHYNTHAAIDGLIAGRDVSTIPARCIALAKQGLAIAQQNGLIPTPTL